MEQFLRTIMKKFWCWLKQYPYTLSLIMVLVVVLVSVASWGMPRIYEKYKVTKYYQCMEDASRYSRLGFIGSFDNNIVENFRFMPVPTSGGRRGRQERQERREFECSKLWGIPFYYDPLWWQRPW